MPDYKESTIAGTVWQRCHQIVIDNVRNATPAVHFQEERVIALDDGQEIRQALGPIDLAFDPAKTFSILDPVSGQSTGATATYGDAYALLYSAYIAAALERDANAPTQAPIDTPAA